MQPAAQAHGPLAILDGAQDGAQGPLAILDGAQDGAHGPLAILDGAALDCAATALALPLTLAATWSLASQHTEASGRRYGEHAQISMRVAADASSLSGPVLVEAEHGRSTRAPICSGELGPNNLTLKLALNLTLNLVFEIGEVEPRGWRHREALSERAHACRSSLA